MSEKKDVSEIINLKVTNVSYVTKGANKKTFFLTKDEAGELQEEIELPVRIIKSDDNKQRLVYGVVSEPGSIDSQGHTMTAETIEKAAHGFLKNFRDIDEMHDFIKGAGDVMESFIALCDMVVNGEEIKKGSWVLVTKATDEIFEKIEKGEYTGYSLAGFGNIKVIKNDETPTENLEKTNNVVDEPEKILITKADSQEIMKSLFSDLEKENENSLWRQTSLLINVLDEITSKCWWNNYDPKKARVEIIESINDFVAKINSLKEITKSENEKQINNVEIKKVDDNADTATEPENVAKNDDIEEIIKKSFEQIDFSSIFSQKIEELRNDINQQIETLKADISEKSVDDVSIVPVKKNKNKKMSDDEKKASLIF